MATKEPTYAKPTLAPEYALLRDHAAAGSWTDVVDEFVRLLNVDEALLPGAADVVLQADADLIRREHEADPSDLVAKAIFADHLITSGWEIRSGKRAQHVSREQFDAFHEHLRQAELLLLELCAVEPEWTYPWYLRLPAAMGLGLGQGEAHRRYERLAAHHPHHYPAQASRLQQLCPKWGGSWDAAFGFARDCAAAAPDGSAGPILVAGAYVERWLVGNDDERAARTELSRPEVREELDEAAARSVFHEDWQQGGARGVFAHTAFGVLHALARDDDRAARHFRELGDEVDDYPWGHLDGLGSGTRERVNKVRVAALAKAGAR